MMINGLSWEACQVQGPLLNKEKEKVWQEAIAHQNRIGMYYWS